VLAGAPIRIRDRYIRHCTLAVVLISIVFLGPRLSWGQRQPTDEQVSFATNVEKIKGHLTASRELYAAGQAAYAAIHAAHPVQELWSLLQGPLTEASPELAKRLGELLEKPGQEIDAKVPQKQYEATVKQVSATLDEAFRRVVPARMRASRGLTVKVIVALLKDVAEEYEEGFKEGKVTQVVEYQDAYGFFLRSQTLYRGIARPLGKKAPEVGNRIERSLAVLAKGFARVMPPSTPLSAAQIKEEVLRVSAELSRVSDF